MSKLVTAAFVKSETDLDDSVASRALDNPIKWAMDRLRFLLGRAFYDQIVTQGTSTPTSFSAANSSLFDPYVKQFLAWQAYEFYLVGITATIKRGGLRVVKDEVDDPAPDSTVNLLIKTAKEQTNFYKGELVNYLIKEQENDSTAFPLYEQDCDNVQFKGSSGLTGISKLNRSQYDIGKKVDNNGD